MNKETQPNINERKPWITPEVQIIEAGSAEAGGTSAIPDGGGPGDSRDPS